MNPDGIFGFFSIFQDENPISVIFIITGAFCEKFRNMR